jgi:hypothetical protein
MKGGLSSQLVFKVEEVLCILMQKLSFKKGVNMLRFVQMCWSSSGRGVGRVGGGGKLTGKRPSQHNPTKAKDEYMSHTPGVLLSRVAPQAYLLRLLVQKE